MTSPIATTSRTPAVVSQRYAAIPAKTNSHNTGKLPQRRVSAYAAIADAIRREQNRAMRRKLAQVTAKVSSYNNTRTVARTTPTHSIAPTFSSQPANIRQRLPDMTVATATQPTPSAPTFLTPGSALRAAERVAEDAKTSHASSTASPSSSTASLTFSSTTSLTARSAPTIEDELQKLDETIQKAITAIDEAIEESNIAFPKCPETIKPTTNSPKHQAVSPIFPGESPSRPTPSLEALRQRLEGTKPASAFPALVATTPPLTAPLRLMPTIGEDALLTVDFAQEDRLLATRANGLAHLCSQQFDVDDENDYDEDDVDEEEGCDDSHSHEAAFRSLAACWPLARRRQPTVQPLTRPTRRSDSA